MAVNKGSLFKICKKTEILAFIKIMITEKRKIGDIGENIACRFLEKRGFKIVNRNYWKKWGEIDIVAKKKRKLKDRFFGDQFNNKIHFVEVKTVSCENIKYKITDKIKNYQLNNNIHSWKLKRLSRVFRTYLLEKKVSEDIDWQFDIIIVFLDLKDNISRIEYLKDIII